MRPTGKRRYDLQTVYDAMIDEMRANGILDPRAAVPDWPEAAQLTMEQWLTVALDAVVAAITRDAGR